jgi:glycosyltransferase involved in cell wall biosynthesis
MEYPRILIIGQYFHARSGGGITLTNLFKDWKKENIAVAAECIRNPDFSVCSLYYNMGSLEFKKRFPFNFEIQKNTAKSGVLQEAKNDIFSSTILEGKHNVGQSGIRKTYSSFLKGTGLNNYRKKIQISDKLLSWIKEFSPDIIYSQLSSIQLIDFVKQLQTTLALPVAIHIMDDWPMTIGKQGMLKSFWNKRANNKFLKLIRTSKILMTISEAMSEEYERRYGQKFTHFHNPIDLKQWGRVAEKSYETNGKFVVLYAGRIGTGIRTSLCDVANTINKLIKKGFEIEFQVQATCYDPILDDLKKFDFIKLNSPVPYHELPGILSMADLLLLANDFDSHSISFLKYSMPTKASEFMISGTPILLYSSAETAVTKHALKHHWSYIVSEKSEDKLESAISELYKKIELRRELGKSARKYAIENFDGEKIREQFRKNFILK